jgi:hypothetical protein
MDSGSANPPAPLSDQPAADGAPSPGGDQRDELCRLLRAARERRSMTIARVTRIPDHSLRRLEAGEFEDLPGDVFVRGFLRSYARCVGLDAADVLRRYAECGMAPAPVASDHALAAAAEAAAMAERDDGAEVGRAVVGGGSGSGSAGGTGTSLVRGTGTGTVAGTGSALVRGTGTARGSGTRAATAGVGKESVAAATGMMTATGTGTGTAARAVKEPATTRPGQPARATTASRGTRPRQRQGRAASQPAARRAVPREARRARSQRAGRWRPSMLAVAIAVLVIAAIAVMSHLLRRPEQRPRGGEAAGSSSR